jgi:hypothetical protein
MSVTIALITEFRVAVLTFASRVWDLRQIIAHRINQIIHIKVILICDKCTIAGNASMIDSI